MFSSETPSNFQANPSKANLLKSARGQTKAHKMYTREKHQQYQEQGKRAQKSTKLETSRKVLT
jgi:hypothetical protein